MYKKAKFNGKTVNVWWGGYLIHGFEVVRYEDALYVLKAGHLVTPAEAGVLKGERAVSVPIEL